MKIEQYRALQLRALTHKDFEIETYLEGQFQN